MFDIGLFELLLLSIIVLLVIGPQRLPETLRTLGLWVGRMRRSFTRVKTEIEREIGMDDVRRQLHNEAIMEQMKEIERDVGGAMDDASIGVPNEQKLEPEIQPEVEPETAPEEKPKDSPDAAGPTGNQAVEPTGPLPDDAPRKARDGR